MVKAHGNEEAALWDHFVTHGLSEGRALSKSFHVFAYRAAYQDLQEAFGNDLIAYYIHYATHGMQENRSVTTISQAVNAGITVTGLRGQVIAKPVPVEIPPAEDTNHEETGNPVAIPETPSPEPVPAPPVTVCTHQYIIKGLRNTEFHAQVCELCGDIDESTQETCTADGYEADLMYHHQKCQMCNRIMFTHILIPIVNARYVNISVSISSLKHPIILNIIEKDALLADLSLWNRIHRDSVNADINLNSLYYP